MVLRNMYETYENLDLNSTDIESYIEVLSWIKKYNIMLFSFDTVGTNKVLTKLYNYVIKASNELSDYLGEVLPGNLYDNFLGIVEEEVYLHNRYSKLEVLDSYAELFGRWIS